MTIQRVAALVSTNWLKSELGSLGTKQLSPRLRVLDCTWTPGQETQENAHVYEEQHIPTSMFFDLNKCVQKSPMIPINLPQPTCFARYVGALGINSDTHIVAYDQRDSRCAARAWWLFRAYGHEKVSVMDGGMRKWLAEGNDTTDELYTPQEEKFTVRLDTAKLRDFSAMTEIIESGDIQVVDVRNEMEFSGSLDPPKPDMLRGCMPDSFNVPWGSLLREDGTFKQGDELLQLLKGAGVDPAQPMVATCLLGVTACGLPLAAHSLDLEVPVYYGSWNEWRQRADPDMAVWNGHAEQ